MGGKSQADDGVIALNDGHSRVGRVHASDIGVMVYAVGMFGSEGLGHEALRTLAEETGLLGHRSARVDRTN
jgi:hypothetical protein